VTTTCVDSPEPERPEGLSGTGLWCMRCMLPSGVLMIAVGQAWRACVECGALLDDEGNVTGEAG
jgi:hypothetical protein